MSRTQLSRTMAILMALALLVAACGETPPPAATPDPGTTPDPAGTPPEGPDDGATGGTLSIGWEESGIDTLDPALAYDFVSWPAIQLMFETLVGYAEASTELVPLLAESMPDVSDDGLVYTFSLRAGVQFVNPDGSVHREMTADDVVHSLNRVLSADLTPTPSPVGDAFFGNVVGSAEVLAGEADEAEGIVALDERTVEITLNQADGTFLNILATPFGSILPADVATTDTEAFAEEPVGTGPYTLESHDVGQEARFVRNTHYWGDPGHADTVVFNMGLDGSGLVQQVEANQIDLMGTSIPAGLWPSIRDDPAYEGRVFELTEIVIQYLSMDTSGPDSPFADVLVRQAVSHAIDKDNIVQLLAGRADPLNCLYPPPLPGFNPDCEGYDYDPDRARELLAEAGMEDGFSTELYTDPSEDSAAITQAIQQDLGEAGITVELVPQAWEVLLDTITTPHEAPLVYIGWIADYPDPSNFYDPILSCAAAAEGGANTSWYCSEENDALAAEAKAEQDQDARFELYAELERQVMEDAPWVSLISPTATILVSDRVVDFQQHPIWTFDLARIAVRD